MLAVFRDDIKWLRPSVRRNHHKLSTGMGKNRGGAGAFARRRLSGPVASAGLYPNIRALHGAFVSDLRHVAGMCISQAGPRRTKPGIAARACAGAAAQITRQIRFFVDLVAARLLPAARTDPRRRVTAGGARAEYPNFFDGDPLCSLGSAAGPGCLNGSIRGGTRRVRQPCTPSASSEGGRHAPASTRCEVTHGGSGVPDSPLMTQLAKPSGAGDG
jgi:hypothetical protein